MRYKDLLVHLDDTRGCARRIDTAIRLAAQYEAHLVGLYLIAEIPLLSYIQAEIPPDLRASMKAEAQRRADAATAAFSQAAERAGISFESRVDRALDPTLARVLGMHARYADLAVLGQTDPDEPPPVGRHLPEKVVVSSGRPVLVVPYAGNQTSLGERVVVAWDAGREAARAVSDALPILERANSVLVVTINPKTTPLGHGAAPGADIALHLARHKIKVEVEAIRAEETEVGQALLSLVAERGYDLIVMGAYAHARMRELILGGATRTVLAGMTVPVLMAH